jgi:hypothetical protein
MVSTFFHDSAGVNAHNLRREGRFLCAATPRFLQHEAPVKVSDPAERPLIFNC